MDQPKLGQLCGADANRDAVHIAVAPVIADEPLQPGQKIVVYSGRAVSGPLSLRPANAVVDPFLAVPVQSGQTFFACLFPNTVQSLRHDLSHPDFPIKDAAKEQVTELAAKIESVLAPFKTALEASDKPAPALGTEEWEDWDTKRCRAEGCDY